MPDEIYSCSVLYLGIFWGVFQYDRWLAENCDGQIATVTESGYLSCKEIDDTLDNNS